MIKRRHYSVKWLSSIPGRYGTPSGWHWQQMNIEPKINDGGVMKIWRQIENTTTEGDTKISITTVVTHYTSPLSLLTGLAFTSLNVILVWSKQTDSRLNCSLFSSYVFSFPPPSSLHHLINQIIMTTASTTITYECPICQKSCAPDTFRDHVKQCVYTYVDDFLDK